MSNSKLYIVTVATENKFYMPYLIESVKRNNGELKILGYGQKWRGFNWRNYLVKEFLDTTNPDDIVCVIDGYDILCLRNLNELTNKFVEISNREKCKIIVGLEQDVVKQFRFWARSKFGYCKNNSVNAGTYIGYSKNLIEIIKKIISINPNDNADDQYLLTKYCNIYNDDVYLDMENELFLTLIKTTEQIKVNEDVKIIDNELIYNNNKPFFIHTPSTFLDDIIIYLNYNYDYNNKPFEKFLIEYNSKKFNQIIDFFYIYYEEFFVVFLIIIFLVMIIIKKL